MLREREIGKEVSVPREIYPLVNQAGLLLKLSVCEPASLLLKLSVCDSKFTAEVCPLVNEAVYSKFSLCEPDSLLLKFVTL